MHRAELVRIGNDVGGYVSIRRSHRGRSAGVVSIPIGLKRLAELIKIAIVRYLIKPRNKRKPFMNHKILLRSAGWIPGTQIPVTPFDKLKVSTP